MMSTSGARGNISQVRQLLAMRGLMADAKGTLDALDACWDTLTVHSTWVLLLCPVRVTFQVS